MTQYNNNLSPLPWYTDIREQNHRKPYAYGEVYPLHTPLNFLLPWQVTRDALRSQPRSNDSLIITPIRSLEIYYDDGTLWRDVTSGIESDLHYDTYTVGEDAYDVITYVPQFAFAYDQPEGRYYAKMTDGTNTWYSEVFSSVADLSALVKVQWWDDQTLVFDAGRVIYDHGYRNTLYLATQLGKPTYNFDEEGEKRDGFFYPTKMLSEKTYHFQFLAPEYMCDAMRLARLSDHIEVTDQYGVVYTCDTFLITPKWGSNGDIATVAAEFDTNTVVKKTGSFATGSMTADFNDDYNDDYSTEQQQ